MQQRKNTTIPTTDKLKTIYGKNYSQLISRPIIDFFLLAFANYVVLIYFKEYLGVKKDIRHESNDYLNYIKPALYCVPISKPDVFYLEFNYKTEDQKQWFETNYVMSCKKLGGSVIVNDIRRIILIYDLTDKFIPISYNRSTCSTTVIDIKKQLKYYLNNLIKGKYSKLPSTILECNEFTNNYKNGKYDETLNVLFDSNELEKQKFINFDEIYPIPEPPNESNNYLGQICLV